MAILFTLISYFTGHKFVLSMSGAVQLNKDNAPEIISIVEKLSSKAGLPMPKVYAINDMGLNAFATGRNPKNSYIAITKGLANTLETDEIEGVIAHELSHIKNHDIKIMLITIACITFSTIIAELLLRYSFFSRRDNSKNNAAFQIFLIALAIVFYLYGYLLAPLIRLAVSRTREFQADATAALITENPQGLINALKKISGHSMVAKLSDKETVAPICIATPLSPSKQGSIFSRLSGLFSTHPPIEKRIEALENIILNKYSMDTFSLSGSNNKTKY
jgi:heat shock protein HtpX